MSNANTVYCSSCHEPRHSRRTFRNCRLNPRNQAVNEAEVVYCSSCGEAGHSRRTFRGCRARNIAEEDVEMSEAQDVDVNMSEAEEVHPTDNNAPVCSHCQRPGHLRSSSRLCPLNSQSTINIAENSAAVPTTRDDRGSMNCVCNECGAQMWVDERVVASSKLHPQFQLCCSKGKSVLTPLQPTPLEIVTLLQGNDQACKEFRKNIRSYNSSLSFTSFGANLDLNLANNRLGSYTFRIQGSPYHLIGSAAPLQNERTKFAQIYIYDAEHELDNRHAVAPHVNIATLQTLQEMMHRINPFVHVFKNMGQIANEQRRVSNSEETDHNVAPLENIKLVFRAEGAPDRRRYNRPTHGSDIGVIIIGGGDEDDNGDGSSRDIIVQYQDSTTKRVSTTQHQASRRPPI